MPKCCVECFEDPFIKDCIRSLAERGTCNYCGTRDVETADTGAVGEFVVEGLERAYRRASDEAGPYDKEEDRHAWGDPTDCPWPREVLEEEGAFSDTLADPKQREQLTDDLLKGGTWWREMRDGDAPLGGGDEPLAFIDEHCGAAETGFESGWARFKYRVLYVARFFDHAGLGETREQLLAPVLEYARLAKVSLKAGDRLWRARSARAADKPPTQAEWAAAVGPAPPKLTKGSRMSPAGISFMYLGDSLETCRAEIERARDGRDRLWAGEFRLRRDVTIIDLTGRAPLALQSVWDPEYEHSKRLGFELLRRFAREISMPVRPEDAEVDYVPTQALSEWLRLAGGIEGLKYPSAARPEGFNVVLFCGPSTRPRLDDEEAPQFPIPSFIEWTELAQFVERDWT